MKPNLLALAGFVLIFLSVSFFASAVSATELSFCQEINAAGYYNLSQNVNSPGTCFTITANEVELDCNGYMINYSQSVLGYGINNTGFNNTIVKNCNIVQGNLSLAIAYEIYVSRMA